MKKQTLLCTVGMSLNENLKRLPRHEVDHETWLSSQPEADREHLDWKTVAALGTAFDAKRWKEVGEIMAALPGSPRLCGAELNSVHRLVKCGWVDPIRLVLFRSDTPGGQVVAEMLKSAFSQQFQQVDVRCTTSLRDDSPREFRNNGLRWLVRLMAREIRNYGMENCAIDATGGYKAQIAVAVVMGQALGVPVYYLFERFPETIAFPPMPVTLDLDLWVEREDLFLALAPEAALLPAHPDFDDWDERLEALLERETVDGREFVCLSAMGQVFHEAASARFDTSLAERLPHQVPLDEKKPPLWEDSGNMRRYPAIHVYMEQVTERLYVRRCKTFYLNPDLSAPMGFRLSREEVVGTWSDGTTTVRFSVETSAQTAGERQAVVVDLNRWLRER